MFNDESVRTISEEDVLNHEAYMLFYSKISTEAGTSYVKEWPEN